jgi:hypothetical protein
MPKRERIKQGLIKSISPLRWQLILTAITKTSEFAEHPFTGELNLRNTRAWNQFTYRADGTVIKKQNRQAPAVIQLWPRELYSPKTSTSFFNAQQNLYPTPFKSNDINFPLAGLLFTTEFNEDTPYLYSDSVIIDRCYKQDCGTFNRPFDAGSEAEAQRRLSLAIKRGNFVRSPLSIAKNNADLNATNEVLARLRWKNNPEVSSPTCYIAIFNQTPITATTALIYEKDLKEQLKAVHGIDEEIHFAFYDKENNKATPIEKSVLLERANAYCAQAPTVEDGIKLKLLFKFLIGKDLSKVEWLIARRSALLVLCIPVQEDFIAYGEERNYVIRNSLLPFLSGFTCITTRMSEGAIKKSKLPLVLWPYPNETFNIEKFVGIDFSERLVFAPINFDLKTLREKNITGNNSNENLDGFTIRLPELVDLAYFHGLPLNASFSHKSMKLLLRRLPRKLARPKPKEQQAYQKLIDSLYHKIEFFFLGVTDAGSASIPSAKNLVKRPLRLAKLLLLLEQLSTAEKHNPITRKHLQVIAATGFRTLTRRQASFTIYLLWTLLASLLLVPALFMKDKSPALADNFVMNLLLFIYKFCGLAVGTVYADSSRRIYIYKDDIIHQNITTYLQASRDRTTKDSKECTREKLALLMSEIEYHKSIRSLVTGIRLLFNIRKPRQQLNFLAANLFFLTYLSLLAVVFYTNLLNPTTNALIKVVDFFTVIWAFNVLQIGLRKTPVDSQFCLTETELGKLSADTLLPKKLIARIGKIINLNNGNNSMQQIQQALEGKIEAHLAATTPDLEQRRVGNMPEASNRLDRAGIYRGEEEGEEEYKGEEEGEEEYKGVEGCDAGHPLLKFSIPT